MWFACFALLIAMLIWQAWRSGPNQAAGRVVVLSLLVPTWVVVQIAGFPLDLRVASGIAALAAYCVHPQAVFRTRLVLLDLAGIGLVAVHLVSDCINDGFSLLVPLQAYGEWVVPYLAGRVAIQSWQDVRQLTPFVMAVCLTLAACSAMESVTRVNPFESICGERPLLGASRQSSRWGFKRAFGPTKNPIYLGTLELLLFPWSVYAAALAFRRAGPRWWILSPGGSAAGILATVSRAPVLALLPLLYSTVVLRVQRWRTALLVVGLVGGALLAANQQAVLEALNRSSGAAPASRRAKITVGGEQVEYTTTLHRLYLFEVYGTAMKRAGLLGFGTERTTSFPPRVPIGPEQAKTLKALWCVDNAYVLLVLRFGFLGMLLFVLMGVSAIWMYARLSVGQGFRRGIFAAGMAGTIVATMLVLMTVWMPHDFGFWFLWTMGSSAGLRVGTAQDPEHPGRESENRSPAARSSLQ